MISLIIIQYNRVSTDWLKYHEKPLADIANLNPYFHAIMPIGSSKVTVITAIQAKR